MDTLWNILLRHQSPRLNAVIVELRQIMKRFNHLLPENTSPEPIRESALQDMGQLLLGFEDCLKLLAELLFSNSDSDLEKHNSLVSLSHNIYRIFPAEHFQALGRAGDKLHQAIGFLGRLRTSFRVLIAAARQISGFIELSLIPVARLKTQRKPLRQEWSLAKTFQALNLQLSDTVINKVMRPSGSKSRWTENRLSREFSQLKSPKWEVHAEIQLIIFILNHPGEVANGKRFDYIGCSRYSCLLCTKFLQSFKALRTRGCHGKLYNQSWTIPRGDNMGTSEQHLLSEVVIEVISWMRKELITSKMPLNQKRLEAKESTVGGSLIAVPGISQENHQQIYAASEHLYRQRAQNSYMQPKKERCVCLINSIPLSSIFAKLYAENDPIRSLSPIEDEEVLEFQARYETLAENPIKLCAGCFKVETTRQCSYCGGAPFCSKICERGIRLSHLLACSMRQVTSADYLYEDILMDELPTDLQVRQDYWFDRCQSKNEESHLVGVFAGLVRYHPNHITREELHQWRSDPGGNLYMVAKIVGRFEELPKGKRGDYFPWFLRYRTRFELPDCYDLIPRTPSPVTQVQNIQTRGRKYLAPEDQYKDFEDLTPFAKMYCFAFFCMAVDNLYPPPINSEHCHWFDFGFVVSYNQYEERRLGAIYNTMLFGSMSRKQYAQSIGLSATVK